MGLLATCCVPGSLAFAIFSSALALPLRQLQDYALHVVSLLGLDMEVNSLPYFETVLYGKERRGQQCIS